jgi:hypothetical protein
MSMSATRSLPRRLRLLLPAMTGALLLLVPAEGSAQYGRTFRSAPKLASSDIEIVRHLVREELTGKPKGTTLSWSNPKTEKSGTVTLLDSFASAGRDCRRVRYVINPGPQQRTPIRPARYVLTSCRLPDGSWKLDSAAKPDTPQR